MERYSRYTDSKGRLFVVLARLAKIDIKDGDIKLTPTTVELLDVHGEKTIDMAHTDFERYVHEGYLKQVQK
jgi:hypothetical protein